MADKKHASRQAAKDAGWYSCRHPSSEAYMATRDARKEHQVQKLASALSRQEERNARSDAEQLARLDIMFGVNKGAQKERTRLLKRLGLTQENSNG